jgi:RNA recognition motif-containing protein
MKIYVGNLSYQVTDEEIKALFEPHGEVTSVTILKDKYTGQPKGFGFIEMAQQEQAKTAINALNNTAVKGRNIIVNEARPKTDKPHGGDRNRRGGGGGGGGGNRFGGKRY